MPTAYPAGLDTLPTNHVDSIGEIIHAIDVNNLADAVNKVEAELGVLPKGTFASVRARLDAITNLTLFNVMDPRFAGGAKGDGVTNDYAAIHAAYLACIAAGGGTVLFPGGHTYFVSIGASTYTEIFTGGGATGTHTLGYGATVKVDPAGGVGNIAFAMRSLDVIEGITVDMGTLQDTICILNSNQTTVRVFNCYLTNTQICIYVQGATGKFFEVVNNILTNGYGLLVQDASTYSLVTFSLNWCLGSAAADAIELNTPTGGTFGWLVEGNIISGYTSTAISAGFSFAVALASQVVFSGNYVTGGYNDAVHVENGSTDIYILGNVFKSNSNIAVYVVSGANLIGRIYIDGNTFIGNGFVNSTHGAAHVVFFEPGGAFNVSTFSINGNHFYNNGKAGVDLRAIEVEGYLSGGSISNNTCDGQLGNGAGGKGTFMFLNGSGNYLPINVGSNTVYNCAGGMTVTGAHTLTYIHDNVLSCATFNIANTATGTVIIKRNPGYATEAGGVNTQTPGATSTVNIPHGLAATPTFANVNFGDANSRGAPAFYITFTTTNIVLNFVSNLAGATAYTWVWSAQVGA